MMARQAIVKEDELLERAHKIIQALRIHEHLFLQWHYALKELGERRTPELADECNRLLSRMGRELKLSQSEIMVGLALYRREHKLSENS
jgi:hypothetical protein